MEHTLTIHKLIHGGKGLGTLADGMVVMVAGVLPGERVTVRETKVHRGHKEAELLRVEEASPDRVEPPCPHYGNCGGCDLMHASYEAQLRIKQEILQESLQRARLELSDDQPLPTLPSPEVFAYRHRIRLHLDNEGRLGYHQAASNLIVPIRRCLLATEPINRVLEALVDQDLPALLKEKIREIELSHSPADERVILALHPQKNTSEKKLADLKASLSSLGAEIVIARKKPGRNGRPTSTITLSQDFSLPDQAYELRWTPSCFFQANALQNPQLIALALKAVSALQQPFSVLDLFCGMGNFSIPMARNGALVLGIEHNHESIHWAAANSSTNDISTTRFIAADVLIQLKKLVKTRQEVDCILFDPPRQGLGEAAALLPQLNPQLIVSISCDPATQARDLREIINGGYRLCHITPVDMFPQTHHIESLALLERN
ncbi:MAG: 23S rRNA (uracil(1939)-C(5))-methyltransferase RlmD [Desulfobulbus sp.]|nr:23S rRNA (uracil(1939)-C(5))-methyltransferase RlmD [Desulfobulbus sp.]